MGLYRNIEDEGLQRREYTDLGQFTIFRRLDLSPESILCL